MLLIIQKIKKSTIFFLIQNNYTFSKFQIYLKQTITNRNLHSKKKKTILDMAQPDFTNILKLTDKMNYFYNNIISNYFLRGIFGRDLILAFRATSHAFQGAQTRSYAAKNNSYPSESKAKPMCFDLSCGFEILVGFKIWHISMPQLA